MGERYQQIGTADFTYISGLLNYIRVMDYHSTLNKG